MTTKKGVIKTHSNEKDPRFQKMKHIRDELFDFTESPLYSYRAENNYFPVIGEGDHYAKIMLVGEAPGENEAKTGKPFCGAAGRILNELLESQDLERESVYISNIVKDRPQKNRDPKPEEIDLYAPFLDRQIEIIQPHVIATLGRFSMEYVMNRYGLGQHVTTISKMHGKSFEATMDFGTTKIVPLYHPAVALYRASMKDALIEDFKEVTRLAAK